MMEAVWHTATSALPFKLDPVLSVGKVRLISDPVRKARRKPNGQEVQISPQSLVDLALNLGLDVHLAISRSIAPAARIRRASGLHGSLCP